MVKPQLHSMMELTHYSSEAFIKKRLINPKSPISIFSGIQGGNP